MTSSNLYIEHSSLQKTIESLVGQNADILAENSHSIDRVIELLDQGMIRVASQNTDQSWTTHAWIKNAILMYFQTQKIVSMEVGDFYFRDKIPLKKNYEQLGVRVVPPAVARFGSFMEKGVIMMPCYINIGGYVGARTMVDTWATVGSCAQIGADVHLSGGVGIGGVLEPASATPVIVEDGAFLGSRCIVVEGVRIGREAVLGANVTLTSATPIIDVDTGEISKGFIPPRSVVLPGTMEKEVKSGKKIFTPCAYIIGKRTESTDRKTSLNQTLREYSVSV